MRKALVVDDESDARAFVSTILKKDGWEVAEAENGTTGLEKAKVLRPELIVLDVQMPEKDGFLMFTDLIKDPDTRDCKVIMLTGVADKVGIRFSEEEMGEFLGKEPDAYVEKPIDPDAFKRVVRRVMGET
jgi:two-component system alkaline phosphatase synthesis response regulator PhoP